MQVSVQTDTCTNNCNVNSGVAAVVDDVIGALQVLKTETVLT